MRKWRHQLMGPGATGAALGVVLFAVALGTWLDLRGVSAPVGWLLILAAAGGGAVAAAALTRRHYLRLLGLLGERAAALQENPSPHALHPLAGPGPAGGDAAPLLARLDALAGCYRKALAELIQTQETLERARTAGRERSDDGVPPPGVVSSSRRRMVARLAPNLHWIAATQPLQKFLGVASADLVARSFLDVVHPDDASTLKHTLHEALRDGEGHNITFRVLPPGRDGSDRERHLQMDVLTWYGEGGTPLHLRCHLLDVSDRVRTEQELRRRTEELSQANDRLRQINADLERLKESYRDLYHFAPMLYFSLDAQGRFVALNETLLRTLGYAREALLGQPYATLLPPGSQAAFSADPAVFQRPGELETRWLKRDGTVIDVWVGNTTIRDERGGFVRSRSAARDVTERNRLANALRCQAEELGRANAQLRRINQELEDFTYVVSHDLKEPLRTLEAFSTFLSQDYAAVLDGNGLDYVHYLLQASRRLGALIDNLLELSRVGRILNAPRPFSWHEALATVQADLRELIQRKRAVVRVEGTLPPVAGDPQRVVQLLSNLISNGLKYNVSPRPEVVLGAADGVLDAPCSAEGGTRAVQAEATVPNGPAAGDPAFVTLFVRDNGLGIDPAFHEQIFRIFRRLHHADDIEGTGAGLAICKKIVEAHGGRLWVHSEPGRGACFYFTLPRLVAPAVAAGRPAPALAGPASGRPTNGVAP